MTNRRRRAGGRRAAVAGPAVLANRAEPSSPAALADRAPAVEAVAGHLAATAGRLLHLRSLRPPRQTLPWRKPCGRPASRSRWARVGVWNPRLCRVVGAVSSRPQKTLPRVAA